MARYRIVEHRSDMFLLFKRKWFVWCQVPFADGRSMYYDLDTAKASLNQLQLKDINVGKYPKIVFESEILPRKIDTK